MSEVVMSDDLAKILDFYLYMCDHEGDSTFFTDDQLQRRVSAQLKHRLFVEYMNSIGRDANGRKMEDLTNEDQA